MYFIAFDNLDGTFSVKMTEEFYKYISFNGHSYFDILYELFGLYPRDFYHYVGAQYNAWFKKGSIPSFILMFFKNKTDCEALCKELNHRFDYCVKNNYIAREENN